MVRTDDPTEYPDEMWQGVTVERRIYELLVLFGDPVVRARSLRDRRRQTAQEQLQAARHYDRVLELLDAPTIVNA